MTNKILLSLFLLVVLSQWQAVAQRAETFSNPIINEDAPDPSVIRADDGQFYLFSTGNRIFRSPDMLNWTRINDCFTPEGCPSFVPGVRRIWAPDINKIGNKYVLYFALSKWGGEDSCGIGVATSVRPEGPYECINGDGKLFRSFEIGVRNSIAPFYIKDKGRHYLIWGSFSGIYAIRLTSDGLSLYPGSRPVQIAGKAYEGSYVYKRKGYYYFFGSVGSCCAGAKSTYTTVVARSKHLLGPYVDRQGRSLLDNQHEVLIHGNEKWAGTGHNAEIFTDKNGDDWIIYHAYSKTNPGIGRMALMDKVHWTNNWPSVYGSTPSALSAKPEL